MLHGPAQSPAPGADGDLFRPYQERLEAALVFRYTGAEGYDYAGTRAFDIKFFIGEVLPGPFWQAPGYVGRRRAVIPNKTYRLRVDFTGKNPNVYYEAGLADAWKRGWIILARSSDDMTFEVRHIRSIRYSSTMGADKKLTNDLRKTIEALGYSRVEDPHQPDPRERGR